MGNEDKETRKKNKVESKKYENHLSKVAYLQKKIQLKQTDRHHQTTTVHHPRGTVPNTKKNQKEVLLLKDIRQTDEWFGRTSLFHE